jgi:hypothetical protein
MSKKNSRMPPVHPGEILREDLMKPLGLSVNGLARELKVPVTRIAKSLTPSAPSMLIQRCVCHATLATHPSSESTFRPFTISALPSTHPPDASSVKFVRAKRREGLIRLHFTPLARRRPTR